MLLKVVATSVLLAMIAYGQGQTSLSGTVRDTTGAVIPGLTVKLTNVNTGESYIAVSNESGNYVLPLVKPGSYNLTAEHQGFKQYNQRGIVLETGIPARIDIQLELGAVSETISVEGTAPLLQQHTGAVGALTDHRTIAGMPLLDRRAVQLARLNGGVTFNSGGFLLPRISVAGGRGGNTAYYIDGGNVGNATTGTPLLSADPPVESMQEFNLSISNYSAEFGRTASGVIQMTTKSGANTFHGSAYEYLRNDKFDARNFFAADKSKLRYNLFGVSLGGPVIRNKTHFFFNYEGNRVRREGIATLNVPTPEEVTGDFSRSSGIIRDPLTRQPFPGNVIPPNRLDPIGAMLASFYPEPNVPGRPSGSANFRTNRPTGNNRDDVVARIDHTINDNSRIYGRFLAWSLPSTPTSVFPVAGADTAVRPQIRRYKNISGTWMHNFNPTTINEFRYTYGQRYHRALHESGDIGQKLKIKGVNQDLAPQVTIAGFTALGANSPVDRIQSPIVDMTIVNNLTRIQGNHTLKFGYEYRYGRNDDLTSRTGGGQFNFNNTATGNALAALLLGWTQRAALWDAPTIRSRSNPMAAYVQDDWKVTQKLTLNIGLRWDLDQPRWEEINNRQNSFDRYAINPVSGTPGIVTFSGRNGLSKYAHERDWNNFGPRLGFAWRASERWVLRGGAGIVFVPQYDQDVVTAASLGFNQEIDLVSPDNGLTPAILLKDGLPETGLPPESALNPGFGAVPVGSAPITSPEFFERNRRTGYTYTTSFNIQRLLSQNFLLELGYLGTFGHKLAGPGLRSINQVPLELMGPGNAQIRRPFPQFSNVSVIAADVGNSNYHGLTIKVEKRYSYGLHFQANYVWSRFIDDVEANGEIGGYAGGSYTNYYDRRSDRGLSGNHFSHRFITSGVYELPVGRGRLFPVENSVLNHVAGGWSTGLILELRTGSPYGVVELVNNTNAFSQGQRPNVVGNPVIEGDRPRAEYIERWFNTAAFAQPAQFTFGNAGRTSGYGPSAVNGDLSILKTFSIAERHTLQFRAEILNFMNRPNFDLPNLSRGHAAFGRITSADGARIIQFGLHYRF